MRIFYECLLETRDTEKAHPHNKLQLVTGFK